MKINLKFGTKQKPVQTGLQVHTHMLAGSQCEDRCKKIFLRSQGLGKSLNSGLDTCRSLCKAN